MSKKAPPSYWLARALRERRLSLGAKATQQDIAVRAGMSVRHFQKIEGGLTSPRVDTLIALAKALKTDLQSLLDRAQTLERRTVTQRSSARSDGRRGSAR